MIFGEKGAGNMAEKKSVKVELESLVVRGEDGAIDEDQSVARFLSVIHQYSEMTTQVSERVMSAVNQVFDEAQGRMSMELVCHFALQKMGANPTNPAELKSLQDEVKNYVRQNAGPQDSGAMFNASWKGKGKGIFRWSDHPDWSDETAAEKKEREKREQMIARLSKKS